MSGLQTCLSGGGLFAGGVLKGYPLDRLHEEIAFLAYYLHWDRASLLDLDHRERARWCDEVSAIHRKGREKSDARPIETMF